MHRRHGRFHINLGASTELELKIRSSIEDSLPQDLAQL
jgi:hypothetical protein